MDEDPVLSTLFEAVNVPRESIGIRYIHALKKSGTEGCSVDYHTAGLCAHL